MELHPGQGVGPYTHGMSLWECMNTLRTSNTVASLTWDDQAPSRSHILLTLTPSAFIRLLFSGATQRLLTCELTSPSIGDVLWDGQPLIPRSSWYHLNDDVDSPPPNPQKLLNSRFGPTYPPIAHPAFSDERVLLYDGVAFGYPEQPQGSGRRAQAYPLARVLVTKRSAKAGPLEFPDVCEDGSDDSPTTTADGDATVADITLAQGSSGSTTLTLKTVSGTSVDVAIGSTTSEDLLCDLGPPMRTHYAEDKRMAIHSASAHTPDSLSSSSGPNPYFYNYFSLGLDFLLHPETHKVLKIVLHANTPGEIEFGRYGKCRWRLRREGKEGGVSSESTAADVAAYLADGDPKGATDGQPSAGSRQRSERRMQLDRGADANRDLKLDRPTELSAYPGVVLEATKNGEIETLWLV